MKKTTSCLGVILAFMLFSLVMAGIAYIMTGSVVIPTKEGEWNALHVGALLAFCLLQALIITIVPSFSLYILLGFIVILLTALTHSFWLLNLSSVHVLTTIFLVFQLNNMMKDEIIGHYEPEGEHEVKRCNFGQRIKYGYRNARDDIRSDFYNLFSGITEWFRP